MKKIHLALMLITGLAILTACGGGNAGKQSVPADAGLTEEQAAEPAKADMPELTLGDADNDNYADLVTAICGVDPNPGGAMTLEKAYGSPGNANLKFKGAKGIEERDLQRLYFERCQAAADDKTVYTTVTDAVNGVQKGEPIKSFDDFKGVNWVYEHKGAVISCAVSKYGGMKSLDSFDLRFGRIGY